MIIVTGGAGMIGSAFVWKLNEMGIKDILIVDKLRTEDKWLNIRKREYYDWMDKENLQEWLSCKENADKIAENLRFLFPEIISIIEQASSSIDIGEFH